MQPEFVIIGARDCTTGQAALTSLRHIRRVEMTREYDNHDTVMQYGSASPVRSITDPFRHNDLTVEINATTSGYGQVIDACYPLAWQKMFDMWVPPQMTEKTQAQVLTHFTFNEGLS
jgi:hypothetical protein